MAFVLPSRADVGVLDPEIAGEGERVIHSDGEQISWTPPPAKPVMPDWSQIKSIRKYFGRTGHQVWPAWVYHPTEQPRLLKNADEGATIGICYRDATMDERSRYGHKAVWDWSEDCLWRPQPYPGTQKFDPQKPGQGKTYMPAAPNPAVAQNALLEALIPTVTAAVVTALKANGPGAPANIDPQQWEAFLQFQAFQKTAAAVDEVKRDVAVNALAAGSDAETEWSLWEEEARSKGIKVDGRWSLERLKSEVEKAA